MNWTYDEIDSLATAVYQRRTPPCPRCGRPIRGERIGLAQRRTIPLDLHCDFCGIRSQYDPIELEEQGLVWSPEQRHHLVSQYRRRGVVPVCPEDGACLVIIKSRSSGAFFKLHCPHCGRLALSSEES